MYLIKIYPEYTTSCDTLEEAEKLARKYSTTAVDAVTGETVFDFLPKTTCAYMQRHYDR